MEPKLPPFTPSDKAIEDTSAIDLINKQMENSIALDLVKKTFSVYEEFRTRNHDRRWIAHDSLYFAYVPAKTWPGSNIARANIGLHLTFQKVETALPAIIQSLFYTGGDYFQVEPRSTSTPAEAKLWQDVFSYILEHPTNDYGHSAVAEFTDVLRQILLYGNGGVRVFWDPRLKRPTIEAIDIRDFYVDPKTPNPSVDKARSVIERRLMTVEDLRSLIEADPENFRQFTADELQALAAFTPAVSADSTKRMQNAFNNVNFDPASQAWLPDPTGRQIEVLIYYSNDRIIWLLNRNVILYNEKNPYGFIPLCFAPCFPVPGRFYAQSIADTQEGFQRYAEALLNGHLDEISLALHPPRALPRSATTTPSQQRWYPGSTSMYDDPKQVNLLQPSASLKNVFSDINLLEVYADKTSGIPAIVSGVPRPGNANRTAAGMQMQMDASSARLLPIVIAFESYLLIPMFYKLYHILRLHTPAGVGLQAMREDKTVYQIPSESIIDKQVKFTMLASSKMLTRDKLQQIVPFLLQTLVQGPMLQGLAQSNLTVDFTELSRMIQEATGISKQYTLVRPLNEQELQAKQQPSPDAMMQAQDTEKDRQLRLQLQQMQSQTDLQKVQMQKQPDPAEEEAAKIKLQYEQAARQIELEAKKQETAQKLQAKQLEMLIKQEEVQNKRQLMQFNMETELQKTIQQARIAQMQQTMMPQEPTEPTEGSLKRMARPAKPHEARKKPAKNKEI